MNAEYQKIIDRVRIIQLEGERPRNLSTKRTLLQTQKETKIMRTKRWPQENARANGVRGQKLALPYGISTCNINVEGPVAARIRATNSRPFVAP